MKIKSAYLLLMILSMTTHAELTTKEKLNDWYKSAKQTTEKALDSGKKSASEGLETTTQFLNKTGKATKEGFKAFKQSFTTQPPSPSQAKQHKDKALSKPYLSVKGYQACVVIKKVSIEETLCLPKYRPLLCKEAVFNQLQSMNSPKPC